MSLSYTKLFNSITESTVWCEPAGTRLVWIAMLAKADRLGRVFASIPGLANLARVSLDECLQAVQTLSGPDQWSRTPDHEGRRIEAIDGGWRLLNYEKYRELRDEEVRREQNREAKRRQRDRAEADVSQDVSNDADSQPRSAQAEAEEKKELSSASAKADAPKRADPIPYQAIVDLYNAKLTGLPKVRELTQKRRTLIRAMWTASPQRQSLDFVNSYFDECAEDNFLNGTGPYREPHVNWRPTFDYLLRADVVTRVFEAALDRMERGQ